MPDLPKGDYERVLIHDNYNSLERLLETASPGKGLQTAQRALAEFNGRFIVIPWAHEDRRHVGKSIALVATAMGSAQTNCLVELIQGRPTPAAACKGVVKIGTCSGLHAGLKEGAVVVADAAVNDEGATHWRTVRAKRAAGQCSSVPRTRMYFLQRTATAANRRLTTMLKREEKRLGPLGVQVHHGSVWSVDAYDCFDKSRSLYCRVGGRRFPIPDTFTAQVAFHEVLGVEMECSALFSAAQALRVPAAALIVVSRTLDRLLGQASGDRDLCRIHQSEQACFEIALDVLANL